MVNEENQEELTEEQKKEQGRLYSLNSLNSDYISSLAAIALNQPQEGRVPEYGNLFSGLYEAVTDNTPDQHSYNALFKPSLQRGGIIDKSRLINGAAKDIEESIKSVKINDILIYMGSNKRPKKSIDGKFLSDMNLSEDETKELVEDCFTVLVNRKARGMLNLREREALSRSEDKYAQAA